MIQTMDELKSDFQEGCRMQMRKYGEVHVYPLASYTVKNVPPDDFYDVTMALVEYFKSDLRHLYKGIYFDPL
jgi:hypothetical protein